MKKLVLLLVGAIGWSTVAARAQAVPTNKTAEWLISFCSFPLEIETASHFTSPAGPWCADAMEGAVLGATGWMHDKQKREEWAAIHMCKPAPPPKDERRWVGTAFAVFEGYVQSHPERTKDFYQFVAYASLHEWFYVNWPCKKAK